MLPTPAVQQATPFLLVADLPGCHFDISLWCLQRPLGSRGVAAAGREAASQQHLSSCRALPASSFPGYGCSTRAACIPCTSDWVM